MNMSKPCLRIYYFTGGEKMLRGFKWISLLLVTMMLFQYVIITDQNVYADSESSLKIKNVKIFSDINTNPNDYNNNTDVQSLHKIVMANDTYFVLGSQSYGPVNFQFDKDLNVISRQNEGGSGLVKDNYSDFDENSYLCVASDEVNSWISKITSINGKVSYDTVLDSSKSLGVSYDEYGMNACKIHFISCKVENGVIYICGVNYENGNLWMGKIENKSLTLQKEFSLDDKINGAENSIFGDLAVANGTVYFTVQGNTGLSYLVKLNQNFDLEWAKALPGEDGTQYNKILNYNNGFLLSRKSSNEDCNLITVDNDGNQTGTYTFGGSGVDTIMDMKCYNGNLVIVGRTTSRDGDFASNITFNQGAGFIAIGSLNQSNIKVLLDNKELSFDQPPIKENDRTLVPMRAIFEAMGATVDWNEATKTITAKKDESIITMQIGNTNMTVSGQTITLDVPPKEVNGRTLVPVRAVAEGLKAGVDWDEETQTVYITSNFYNMNVNNLIKNKAYSIFINPSSDDGHKVWEYNYKDDLNMTEKEYKNYVYSTSVGAALLETGVDISNFDFGDLFGNNNQKEYMEDAVTRLLVPTEEETKTMVQKNLEGISSFQKNAKDTISIGSDLIDIYKQVKGKDYNYNKMMKDVGGEVTDKGLTIGLDTVNDTISELILLKTIADTYDIIGNHYEQFINDLSKDNTATDDKNLIIETSKSIIEKYKKNTSAQILSAFTSALGDNTIKEAIKWLLTNGIAEGSEKITFLKGTIALTITKLLVSRQIESSKSWLAFAGMNSIQKLAASEYEILLSQAKAEKGPLSEELQTKLKNAALVYVMSSIKCRNLLLTTVEKSQIIPNDTKIEPLKNNLDTRNNIAYQVFEAWKNAQVISFD